MTLPSAWRSRALMQALALIASFAVAWVARAAHLNGPFSIDEYAYVTLGREVLHGELPLATAWLDRGPICALTYALPLLLPLSLDHALGTFAFALFAATAYLVYRLLAAHAGPGYGWFGLLAIGILSADPGIQATGANLEIPLNFLLVGSLVLALPAAEPPRLGRLFLAALVLGAAVALKETAAVFAPLLLAAPAARAGLRPMLERCLVAICGVMLPYALVWLVYAALGQQDLLLAVSSFHAGYASLPVKDLAAGPILLMVPRGWTLFALWPCAIAALWLLVDLPWRRDLDLAVRVYILCAAAAVIAPGYFHAHYYLLLLPPCVLAAALWLRRLTERGVSRRAVFASGLLIIGWLAAIEARMASGHVPYGVTQLAPVFPADSYRRALGLALARRATAAERLLVVGCAPSIYAHSGLRPATPDVWGLTMTNQIAMWSWSMEPWLVHRTSAALTARLPEWIVIVEKLESGEVDSLVASLLHTGYQPVDLGIGPGDGSFPAPLVYHRLPPDPAGPAVMPAS